MCNGNRPSSALTAEFEVLEFTPRIILHIFRCSFSHNNFVCNNFCLNFEKEFPRVKYAPQTSQLYNKIGRTRESNNFKRVFGPVLRMEVFQYTEDCP